MMVPNLAKGTLQLKHEAPQVQLWKLGAPTFAILQIKTVGLLVGTIQSDLSGWAC